MITINELIIKLIALYFKVNIYKVFNTIVSMISTVFNLKCNIASMKLINKLKNGKAYVVSHSDE